MRPASVNADPMVGSLNPPRGFGEERCLIFKFSACLVYLLKLKINFGFWTVLVAKVPNKGFVY